MIRIKSESHYSESASDFISNYLRLNRMRKLELRKLDTKILNSTKTIYIVEEETPKGLVVLDI